MVIGMVTKMPSVYRMRNADGELLYIGVSIAVIQRVAQHKVCKGWFYEISHIDIEHFDCLGDAESAEIEAIKSEKPKYNIAHMQDEIIQERSQADTPAGMTPTELAYHNLAILHAGMDMGDGEAGMHAVSSKMQKLETETYAELVKRARIEIDGMVGQSDA